LSVQNEQTCAGIQVPSEGRIGARAGTSRPARFIEYLAPEFSKTAADLRLDEARACRKQWEWIVTAMELSDLGALRPGGRGLGFAVGREPLSAYFASRGVSVIGTDQPPAPERVAEWAASNDYARSAEDLWKPGVCSRRAFDRLVRFQYLDMRVIPEDLGTFDFIWSSCALEHLGSLEAGWEFVERAMRLLKPGGVAVHTTEFNVGSNDATLDSGGVVAYRRRDIEELHQRLTRAGHWMEPPSFDLGRHAADHYVSEPPHDRLHFSLRVGDFVLTSYVLIVVAGTPSG